MGRFLIYALTCPKCGAVRYVGKSSSGMNRPRAHAAPSQRAHLTYRGAWVRSLLAEGLMYGVHVLETLPSQEGLAEAERRWIAHGRAEGWRLTNLTDGGDGTPGWKPTPEQRARMSDAAKNKSPEARANMAAARRGKRATPETIKKLRAVHSGVVFSDAWRRNISAALQGKPKPYMAERNRSPEMRAKVSAGLKGKKKSAEHMAALQTARRGLKFSDASRAKMSAAQQGRTHTPETKAKISASHRARHRPRWRINLLGASA